MFEKFRNLHPGHIRRGEGLAIGGMGLEEMINRSTGGGLTAFVEPEARNHPRIIRAPHAGHEARRRCRGHDAGRGPHDVSKTAAHIDRRFRPVVPTDRAHATGVSVN